MRALGRFASRYWFDGLILVGLGLAIAIAVHDTNRTHGPNGPLSLDIVLVVAMFTPLLARRRFPFAAPATGAAVVTVSALLDNTLVPDNFAIFLLGCAVVFLMALLPDWRQALAGLAIVIGAHVVVTHEDPRGSFGNFLFGAVFFSVFWVVGFLLGRKFQEGEEAKARAIRAEREREERARAAVAEERARIARELHDVVGHSVSVMTVQASGVRRLLLPEQEREREALLVVERTGREALAEMRRMVGVLRRPEEAPALAPQPSLEHLAPAGTGAR